MLILQRRNCVEQRARLAFVVVAGDDGRGVGGELGDAFEHVLRRVRREVGDQLVVDGQVRRQHEEVVDAVRQVQVADEAPMSRVLPTPVARAKQSEGNSRSKSVTEGNSLWMAASAAATIGILCLAGRSR